MGFFFLIKFAATNKVNEWDAKYTDLMEQLWKGQDGQPAERSMLRAPPSNLTTELKVLQNQHNTLAASLDRLQKELNRLNANRTGRQSLVGWGGKKNTHTHICD